jgi:hypothetical protein
VTARTDRIRAALDALRLPRAYDPRDVEAWMRIGGAVDALSPDRFRAEVERAVGLIDGAYPSTTALMRAWYFPDPSET